MTESEFIAKEQAKHDRKNARLLRGVHHTGRIGRENGETYLCNNLIAFGGPRPEISNPYNCFRLTKGGVAMLDEIEFRLSLAR
jgi:hypothetical protein